MEIYSACGRNISNPAITMLHTVCFILYLMDKFMFMSMIDLDCGPFIIFGGGIMNLQV
jgi:hypothetical protein